MGKKIVTIVALVLIVGFLLALMPWGRQISVETTAYEYALDQKEPLAVHEVTIEGRYTYRLFRENVFEGTLAVSGYPETEEAKAYVQFWEDTNPGMISYQSKEGYPLWREEIQSIYCSRDFTRFTILLFEYTQEGDETYGSWDVETGRVLCANAPDYDTMAAYSAEVGVCVQEEVE